jgi:hypothetical protein
MLLPAHFVGGSQRPWYGPSSTKHGGHIRTSGRLFAVYDKHLASISERISGCQIEEVLCVLAINTHRLNCTLGIKISAKTGVARGNENFNAPLVGCGNNDMGVTAAPVVVGASERLRTFLGALVV